jgi:hypothetical protein
MFLESGAIEGGRTAIGGSLALKIIQVVQEGWDSCCEILSNSNDVLSKESLRIEANNASCL